MESKNCDMIIDLSDTVYSLLSEAVTPYYARYIVSDNRFMNAIIEDVMDSSNYTVDGIFNDDDVRYAIGRKLMKSLYIEI